MSLTNINHTPVYHQEFQKVVALNTHFLFFKIENSFRFVETSLVYLILLFPYTYKYFLHSVLKSSAANRSRQTIAPWHFSGHVLHPSISVQAQVPRMVGSIVSPFSCQRTGRNFCGRRAPLPRVCHHPDRSQTRAFWICGRPWKLTVSVFKHLDESLL